MIVTGPKLENEYQIDVPRLILDKFGPEMRQMGKISQ